MNRVSERDSHAEGGDNWIEANIHISVYNSVCTYIYHKHMKIAINYKLSNKIIKIRTKLIKLSLYKLNNNLYACMLICMPACTTCV